MLDACGPTLTARKFTCTNPLNEILQLLRCYIRIQFELVLMVTSLNYLGIIVMKGLIIMMKGLFIVMKGLIKVHM